MSAQSWTDLLLEANKLKREDKLLLIKSLAGTAGMIACFPNQVAGNPVKATHQAKGQPRVAEKRKVQEAKASNPLKGTEIAKAFQQAKKAVSTAKKAGEVDPGLLEELESSKKAYFEALQKARGEAPDAPETEAEGS